MNQATAQNPQWQYPQQTAEFGLKAILAQARVRVQDLQSRIAALPSLQKELETLERMLAAAEGTPPCEVCGEKHG
jgi:hypothetical protein